MAEFVVNVALIAALLVLLTVWTVRSRRRRRSDRAQDAEQRRLILAAVTRPPHQRRVRLESHCR